MRASLFLRYIRLVIPHFEHLRRKTPPLIELLNFDVSQLSHRPLLTSGISRMS